MPHTSVFVKPYMWKSFHIQCIWNIENAPLFFNSAAISRSVYIAALAPADIIFCCGEIAGNLRIFFGKNARNVVPVASKTCFLQAVPIYVINPSRPCATLGVLYLQKYTLLIRL